jgi:pimeloyl-ACP methyl ester carboxylesterase
MNDNKLTDNLKDYCATGTKFTEKMVDVSYEISLRVIEFTPSKKTNRPTVLFIPGWISLMKGWKVVLKEMTEDFHIIYAETREKISSNVKYTKDFSVEAIAGDLVKLIDIYDLKENEFIMFGSSLGGTAILESFKMLNEKPLCFALLGPNAEYRTPLWGRMIIKVFWIRLYPAFKQFVKWYLKNFRLDIENDRAQYEKYCNALDAADPKKLKPGALALAKYKVWEILSDIDLPVLIIGATKDLLHEPENLLKIDKMLPNSTFLDMGTNTLAHGPEMVVELRKYIESLK